MGELSENHSSTLRKFTRVKSAKKQAKKTIGITLSPHLLAEARNLHACTDIIPIIPATVDFDPDVLNLKSIDQ